MELLESHGGGSIQPADQPKIEHEELQARQRRVLAAGADLLQHLVRRSEEQEPLQHHGLEVGAEHVEGAELVVRTVHIAAEGGTGDEIFGHVDPAVVHREQCDAGDDAAADGLDRKSVVKGKSVSVRVDLGGRLLIQKKIQNKK